MTTDPAKISIDQIEAMIANPTKRDLKGRVRENTGYVKPRNAATIILVDGPPDDPKVLMGKRNKALKFMPGALVFPGGSIDRNDGSVPSNDSLSPQTDVRLQSNMRGKSTTRGARALAIAAIRETAEESGLLLGEAGKFNYSHPDWELFQQNNIVPSLSGIRLFARAVTPPDLARRFDTWFFVVRKSAIAHTPKGGFAPSGELEELQWISPHKAVSENTREITRIMLVELLNRLREDPDLSDDYPSPYYHAIRGKFQRSVI